MRARLAIILVLVLGPAASLAFPAAAAEAAEPVTLAQEVGEGGPGEADLTEEDEAQQTGGRGGSGEGEGEEGEGSGDPEAETDPGAGEEAAQETGPPWTYQMARIGLVLILVSAAAIGLLYYRLVIQRQRRAL